MKKKLYGEEQIIKAIKANDVGTKLKIFAMIS
jgi:hypothetical protein